MESIGRITPMAAEIAPGEADKNTWETRKGGFALNRFENFGYDHRTEQELNPHLTRFLPRLRRLSIASV
jgi:hypothetical protein